MGIIEVKNIEKICERNFQINGSGYTKQFEEMLCEFSKKKYCLTFNSATSALFAVQLALEIKDSEVITSCFNWGSSIGTTLFLNNKVRIIPTFDDLTINTDFIKQNITSSTKAILAVDFGGNPSRSHTIREICDEYGLLYIADASQSFGGKLANGEISSFYADAIIYSFSSHKTFNLGEGGAVLTDNKALYNKLLNFMHPNRKRLETNYSYHDIITPMTVRMHPIASYLGILNFQKNIARINDRIKRVSVIKDLLKDEVIFPVFHGTSTYFYIPVYGAKNVFLRKVNNGLQYTISKDIPFTPLIEYPQIVNDFREQIIVCDEQKIWDLYNSMRMVFLHL